MNLNIAKATRSNAIYASHLSWLQFYPRILSTIGLSSPPISAGIFIEKIAIWQDQVGGLSKDGMLGPNTWRRLRPNLDTMTVNTTIPDWLRSPIAQGWRQAIIYTLRRETSFLRLTNMTHQISPADFIRLAELIEQDQVTIVATRGGSSASYEYRNEEEDANSIKTPHRVPISWKASQGLIVHEACHAISDMKRRKQPLIIEEATAYVVQQMFLQKFNVYSSTNSLGQVIHNAAKPLAEKYLKGQKPSEKEWDVLKNILRNHPIYSGKEKKFPFLNFDGMKT